MGSCVTSDDSLPVKKINIPQNLKLSENVYKPLFSILYNFLRKRNEIAIIRSETSASPLFEGELQFDFSSLKQRDIKMLCGDKTILLISPSQTVIAQLLESSNGNPIFTMSEEEAKEFLTYFPIFRAGVAKVEPRKIPILVANSQ